MNLGKTEKNGSTIKNGHQTNLVPFSNNGFSRTPRECFQQQQNNRQWCSASNSSCKVYRFYFCFRITTLIYFSLDVYVDSFIFYGFGLIVLGENKYGFVNCCNISKSKRSDVGLLMVSISLNSFNP